MQRPQLRSLQRGLKASLYPSYHTAYPLPKGHLCSLQAPPLPTPSSTFISTHLLRQRNPRPSMPSSGLKIVGEILSPVPTPPPMVPLPPANGFLCSHPTWPRPQGTVLGDHEAERRQARQGATSATSSRGLGEDPAPFSAGGHDAPLNRLVTKSNEKTG